MSQGRQDILVVAIGREEHPGCIRTAGYGVGVRIFWLSFPVFICDSSNKQLASSTERTIKTRINRRIKTRI